MAAYTINSGDIGSPAFALTAGQVSTVTFADDLVSVEVIADGTSPVWWTCNGNTPTVGSTTAYYIPTVGVDERQPTTSGSTIVKLISAGTPTVRVQRGD